MRFALSRWRFSIERAPASKASPRLKFPRLHVGDDAVLSAPLHSLLSLSHLSSPRIEDENVGGRPWILPGVA